MKSRGDVVCWRVVHLSNAINTSMQTHNTHRDTPTPEPLGTPVLALQSGWKADLVLTIWPQVLQTRTKTQIHSDIQQRTHTYAGARMPMMTAQVFVYTCTPTASFFCVWFGDRMLVEFLRLSGHTRNQTKPCFHYFTFRGHYIDF